MYRRERCSTCWNRQERRGTDQSGEIPTNQHAPGLTPLKAFVTVASRGQPFRRRMAKQSQAAKTAARRVRPTKPAVKKAPARKKLGAKPAAVKATGSKSAPRKAAAGRKVPSQPGGSRSSNKAAAPARSRRPVP